MEPTRHEYGQHRRQFGELTRPTGTPRAGTVVLVHGGFWRARYTLDLQRPLAADLAGRGYTVWNLEYRTVGSDGGWPATLDDLGAGLDLLADLDVDTAAVVAVGHSAGGHLVTWATGRAALPEGAPGAAPRVALTAAVSQAGVVALERAAREGIGDGAVIDFLGGDPDTVPERYRLADPLAAVPAPVPVVCVHGRADGNVPLSQSEAYVAAARAAGGDARLVETDGDHFTLIDPTAPDWQAVVELLPVLLAG